jgi:hypothetical protein
MMAIQWPLLELPLLSYILAANLLTIFIGYVAERKILKEFIYDFVYLFLIVSTLLIFFSVAIDSEDLEIFGIIITLSAYFLVAFIFAFMICYWLKTAVKGMCILREYKRGIKEDK